MRGLLRCLAGYVLDFLRERVTADDFRGERIQRVLLTPELDSDCREVVRRMFPGAALHTFSGPTSLARIRSMRFDVSCVAMAGGEMWQRLKALLSGARHKLLIPSPHYIYRLGMRQGPAALAWALIDRFLVAPLALVWLGLIACWLYAGGVVGRAGRAELADVP